MKFDHLRKLAPTGVELALLIAAFWTAGWAQQLQAQASGAEPFAGTLLSSEEIKPGNSAGISGGSGNGTNGTDLGAALKTLRDLVYNNASPEQVTSLASDALKAAQKLGSPTGSTVNASAESLIAQSKIEYYIARSWLEHDDKKKATTYFETALKHAEQAGKSAETAESLYANVRSLSQLVLLKGMPYLLANGPKIEPTTKKILSLEPDHAGAQVMLASAKAYPPATFGGEPKEAISKIQNLLSTHKGGFEKDTLFDLRACMGTAYAKLGDKALASFWFKKALELYPQNIYAKTELEKLQK
ncbi:MAG TPA: hypothetical protein PLT87_08355 [Spirochaetales bacterium]|nr:hypothetical protein [Spirochaetales bacterium]